MFLLFLLPWLPVALAAGLGNARQSYRAGDPVQLQANDLTSIRTQAPIAYSGLPFCKIETTPKNGLNLGEILQGDSIEVSAYTVKMLQDEYCKQVCVVHQMDQDQMAAIIQNDYRQNWILDGLNQAYKTEDEATITTRYWQGFPVGFFREADDTHSAYVHNHVNIEVQYNRVGPGDLYNVVRFTVEPFSIEHAFEPAEDDGDDNDDKTDRDADEGKAKPFKVADISNPIPSCLPENKIDTKIHTNFDMLYVREPQIASGDVLFTYDVIWTENKVLSWSDRWDIYLTMDNAIPDQVHYYSIANSIVVLTIVLGIILTTWICRLRNAAKLAPIGDKDDEEQDGEGTEVEEEQPRKACCNGSQKWRLLHGDVFRPPRHPKLLAALCGTGAHLLSTCLVVLTIGFFGAWHPSHRGALAVGSILVYAMLGGIGGFIAERKCQELGVSGVGHKRIVTLGTAFCFPGLLFAFFLGVFFWRRKIGSTLGSNRVAIPILLALWLVGMVPLTFFGAWLGQHRHVKEFPVETAETPRLIPKKPCFMGYFCPVFAFVMNALWPFGASFVELYFTLSSMWTGIYHPTFQFLGIVFALVVATCALVNILTTYWQLSRENHLWWWCSFRNGASTGFFILVYAGIYFADLKLAGAFAYFLYFGSMALVSLGVGLMLGFVGLSSSLWFNRAIFGMIAHTN